MDGNIRQGNPNTEALLYNSQWFFFNGNEYTKVDIMYHWTQKLKHNRKE